MREIKFRILGSDKKWYYFTLSELLYGESMSAEYCDIEWETKCEYTGLKDKNGKEIYEGDIVKGTTYRYGYDLPNGEQFDYMGQVIWLDGETIGYHVMDIKEAFWDIRNCVHRNDVDFITGEIIGNIYENESLLTSNKSLLNKE